MAKMHKTAHMLLFFSIVFSFILPYAADTKAAETATLHSTAAKEYTIGAFYIPGLIIDKKNGKFIEIHHQIIQAVKYKTALKICPAERVIQRFINKEIIGFFPGSATSFQREKKNIPFIKTVPFFEKKEFLFTRTTDSIISKLEELNGKTADLTRGYPYPPQLLANKKIKFEYAKTDVQNFKKLSSGRIDAFPVEEKSGVAALEKSGAVNIRYDKDSPIFVKSIFYYFQDTPEGKQLAQAFNHEIQRLEQKGVLKKILEE